MMSAMASFDSLMPNDLIFQPIPPASFMVELTALPMIGECNAAMNMAIISAQHGNGGHHNLFHALSIVVRMQNHAKVKRRKISEIARKSCFDAKPFPAFRVSSPIANEVSCEHIKTMRIAMRIESSFCAPVWVFIRLPRFQPARRQI